MKTKVNTYCGVFALAILLFVLGGCKKENLTEPVAQSHTKNAIEDSYLYKQGPREMMTLSAIAMRFHQGAREELTKELLADPNLSTGNNWDLVWYAYDEKKSAQMMVVKNKTIPNYYAIVSKGQKEDNVYSLYHGLYVFGGSKWPWVIPGSPQPTIAKGAMSLANILFNLRGDAESLGLKNVTLEELFKNITDNWNKKDKFTVYVTGHSLGGANAVMIGTYMFQKLSAIPNIPDSKISLGIWNFAGPNLFQEDFVNYYRNTMGRSRHIMTIERFYLIRNDVVPNLWPMKMEGLKTIFPWSGLMKIPVNLFVAGFNGILKLSGQHYMSVNTPDNISQIYLDNVTDPKLYDLPKTVNSIGAYTKYYSYNHFTDNYLRAVGAPPVPEVENGKIIPSDLTPAIKSIDDSKMNYVPTEADVNKMLDDANTPPAN
ncbi:MAG: hypothetical protein ACEPOV_03695 [Hyphomicrobiales bacterium]